MFSVPKGANCALASLRRHFLTPTLHCRLFTFPLPRMASTTAGSKPNVPMLKLNDGNEIPMIAYGLGTANAKRGDKLKDGLDEDIVNMTVKAIKAGYLHLDGAEVYKNEAEMGAAIKASKVPRENLFVTTKLFSNKSQPTMACLDISLQKLGLDYVDLYLIHTPYFAEDDMSVIQKQWAEMEACKASGKARSIGVSNFLQPHLEAILETAKVTPAINQTEYHPYLQHGNLVGFQREKGIATAAYGPLTAVVRAKPGPLDPVYERLATKYGVSEAEVALKWTLDSGVVAITTSSNEDRLKGYLSNLPTFNLTLEEVAEISEKGKEKHHRGFFISRFGKDDTR